LQTVFRNELHTAVYFFFTDMIAGRINKDDLPLLRREDAADGAARGLRQCRNNRHCSAADAV